MATITTLQANVANTRVESKGVTGNFKFIICQNKNGSRFVWQTTVTPVPGGGNSLQLCLIRLTQYRKNPLAKKCCWKSAEYTIIYILALQTVQSVEDSRHWCGIYVKLNSRNVSLHGSAADGREHGRSDLSQKDRGRIMKDLKLQTRPLGLPNRLSL